jgi:hypothetical protein
MDIVCQGELPGRCCIGIDLATMGLKNGGPEGPEG